jgi:hypothetical protein
MKTTDLFKINRSSKRLNESMFKTFGRKLNLETFTIEQLEDARNKLRTQIYTARSGSGFNENIENDKSENDNYKPVNSNIIRQYSSLSSISLSSLDDTSVKSSSDIFRASIDKVSGPIIKNIKNTII